MRNIFVPLLLISVLLISGSLKSQIKVGYINVQEVIAVMPETKKADTAFRDYQAALQASLIEKEQTLNAAIAKISGPDSVKLTPAQKEIKKQQLQKQYVALAQEKEKLNEVLQEKENQLLIPIQKKALDSIQKVAKEGGYTYVFVKGALLVAPSADDLLPLVKKKLGLK